MSDLRTDLRTKGIIATASLCLKIGKNGITKGVFIQVNISSLAEAAGLAPGDILLQVENPDHGTYTW